MTIQLKFERLMTFARAAKFIPERRLGRPVSSSTPWRWHKRGVLIDGHRIYLEAVRTPSGYATSVAALDRFFAQLSGRNASETMPATTPSVVAEGIRDLDRDGI